MKSIFSLLLIALPLFLFSQEEIVEDFTVQDFKKYTGHVMIGLSSYEGDLHCFEDEELGLTTNSKFAFGIGIKRNFNYNFSAGINFRHTTLAGDDNKFSVPSGHTRRGFSFTNAINELSVRADYTPLGHKDYKIQPYVFAGLGLAFGKADTDYQLGSVDNPPIDDLVALDMKDATSTSFALPLGIGIKANVNDKISVSLEAGLRFLANDYLDGVSKSGNSEVNDYYGIGGVTLGYSF